ncbi:MAG: DUF4382 domain-containing protein [Acidobacteriia bacterium]|nr:DUF4382 domain-containing protein [Terriglobia bacterium]
MRSAVRGRVVAGILFTLVLLSLVVLTACGSTTNIQGSLNRSTGGMVQVTIGDAPSDRIAAFSITINSISLATDAGNSVSLVSSPVTVEITQLSGTTQPVATLTIPAGTYTKASITLGTATVTLVDPATGEASQKTLPAPPTVTLTLNPAFALSVSPLVLNLDLNLASSITIDASGNIGFNPRFIETHGPLGGPGTTPTPLNGGLEHLFGNVSSVSGSSFTLAIGNQTLTFTTNGSTQFANLSGVGQITAGMLLIVSAQTQSDGSLLATRVAAINVIPTSIGALGLVRTVNRTTSQLQLFVRRAAGTALTPFVGAGLLVDFNSNTAFRFDSDGVDLSNLPFIPAFAADNIAPGQFVEVDTTSPPVGTTTVIGGLSGIEIAATQITLEQEPLIGIVSGYTGGATFTLNLPADSVFAIVTKATAVTVYKQPGTVNLTNISNGSTVIVRGLLFVDSGTYKMVAGRILATP